MELYAKDVYRVHNLVETKDYISTVLTMCYLPLIGKNAVCLYEFLLNDHYEDVLKTHTKLCLFLDISIDELEHARIKLEQYGLLKTGYSKSQGNYLYVLKQPLIPSTFLTHYLYGIQLKKMIGAYEFDELRLRFQKEEIDTTQYSDITEKFSKKSLLSIQDAELNDFILSKTKSSKSKRAPGFNYEMFELNLTELTFPKKLRTNENYYLIGQAAITYGISEDRIRVLASRSCDIEKMVFNQEAFLRRVRKENPLVEEAEVGYSSSPIVFLQQKQFDAPLANSDKIIIEKLVNDYGMPFVVVNILIEFILENNNNMLQAEYVYKVATSWIRSGVKTKEEAMEYIKSISRNNKEKDMRMAKVSKKADEDVKVVHKQDNELNNELEGLLKELKQ